MHRGYNPSAMAHEDFSLHERLTRSLAYMLRHQPDEFDLEVDRYGWAELGEVVRALTERVGSPIEEDDVHEALAAADRPRYELKDGKIRALYGHSIEVDPGDSDEPPDELFAVVRGRDVPNVERDGLKSVRRTFIHLSLTKDEAREAGRRLARRYAVVTVMAADAWEDGVDFYDRTSIFLSEDVPTDYIEDIDEYDDGEDRDDDRRRGRGRGRGGDRGRDRGRGRGRRGGRGGRGPHRDNDRFEHAERFEGESAETETIDEIDETEPPKRSRRERPARSEERAPAREAEPVAAEVAPKEAPAPAGDGFGMGLAADAPAPAAAAAEPAPEPRPEPAPAPEAPTESSTASEEAPASGDAGFGVGLD